MTLQQSGIRAYALNGLFTQLLGLNQYRSAKEKEMHMMEVFKVSHLDRSRALRCSAVDSPLPFADVSVC